MSDNAGRLRAESLALADRNQANADCPSVEELWDGALGNLTPRQARRVADHLASCPVCVEAWRLAKETGEAIAPEGRAAAGSPARRRWLGWSGAVAAVVALISIGLPTARELWRSRSMPDAYRGGGSGIRSLVPEQEPLPREHAVLRWTTAGEGARYGVRLTGSDLSPLISATDLEISEYSIPSRVFDGLPHGSTLLWQVDATLPDGRHIISSTFVARVP